MIEAPVRTTEEWTCINPSCCNVKTGQSCLLGRVDPARRLLWLRNGDQVSLPAHLRCPWCQCVNHYL